MVVLFLPWVRNEDSRVALVEMLHESSRAITEAVLIGVAVLIQKWSRSA